MKVQQYEWRYMEVSTTPFQLTTKVWFSGRNAGSN